MTARSLRLMSWSAVVFSVFAFSSNAKETRADPIVLPDLQSDDGTLVRLLLVESRNPGYADYDEAKALAGMKAMKAVVDNRLNHVPTGYSLKDFSAAGAKNYRDIITAKNQFDGFSKGADGKVVLKASLETNLGEILKKANTGTPGKYHKFCKNALAVAGEPAADPFQDLTKIGDTPVTGRAYGWRTEGSGSPGNNFVAIPEKQGGLLLKNQFYTLKKR